MTPKAVTEDAIRTRLREILETADLQKQTTKMLRKQLEAHFEADLSGHKKLIRAEIDAYLVALTTSATTTAEATSEASKRGGGYGSLLSPEMSAFFGGAHEMPRTQVVKALWDYIKTNNLQNPKDRRKIILDEELGKLFKAPLTMFNMNKQLSRHCKTDDRRKSTAKPAVKKEKKKAGSAGSAKKKATNNGKLKAKGGAKKASSAKSKAKTKPKKKKVGAAGAAADGSKKRGGGGFGTVAVLEPLRSFMGTNEASRTEVVKKIWDYIKANNCKDPQDGRNIVPDSTLGKFLTPPVNMFNMNKQLSQYLEKIQKSKSPTKSLCSQDSAATSLPVTN